MLIQKRTLIATRRGFHSFQFFILFLKIAHFLIRKKSAIVGAANNFTSLGGSSQIDMIVDNMELMVTYFSKRTISRLYLSSRRSI